MTWKMALASSLISTGLAVAVAVGPAAAVDAVLYEVTENVKLKGPELSFRSSNAKLLGRATPGTAICPAWLAQALNVPACTLTVDAIGRADERTGIGPMSGQLVVLAQDFNTADAPEIPIMRAPLNGTIDLSPGLRGEPIGYITGTFHARGEDFTLLSGYREKGRFTGTFRLPFDTPGGALYLTEAGPVPIQPEELVLGAAAVKLEVTIQPWK
jgi:hypothetical protein